MEKTKPRHETCTSSSEKHFEFYSNTNISDDDEKIDPLGEDSNDNSSATIETSLQIKKEDETTCLHGVSAVHQCPLCAQTFPRAAKLSSHLERIHHDKPRSYPISGLEFDTRQNADRQEKESHDGELDSDSSDSSYTSGMSQNKDMQQHEEFIPTCKSCDKTFKSVYTLKNHMAIHANDKAFLCPVCGHGFSFKHALKVHVRKHVGDSRYSCPQCDKKFYTSNDYSRHLRTHSNDKPYHCSICDNNFTELGSLKRHLKIHSLNALKCPVCSVEFVQNFDFKRHIKTHKAYEKIKCNLCDRRFIDERGLKDHEKSHAKGSELPFACETCGKTYPYLSSLKGHMVVHTGEKPYSCSVCQRHFTTKCSMKRHLRIHTKEKPYNCDTCSRDFADLGNLRKHQRLHAGIKPFCCSVCSKTFSLMVTLQRHLRTHTGEKTCTCNICGKELSDSGNLPRHMLVHTGEKPYGCSECERRFLDTSNLKKHMLTHNGHTREDNHDINYSNSRVYDGCHFLNNNGGNMVTHGSRIHEGSRNVQILIHDNSLLNPSHTFLPQDRTNMVAQRRMFESSQTHNIPTHNNIMLNTVHNHHTFNTNNT